jgi:hypothetical protein
MKSLIGLLQGILADASIWCRASTARDLEEITRRVKYEGLSFMTITLPRFAQDFERGLELKTCATLSFDGFRRRKNKSLPEFLRGLTWLVFDSSTGVILDKPDTQAIFFVRQICLMFKKILLPCTERRTRKAFSNYIQCENEIAGAFAKLSRRDYAYFGNISDILLRPALHGVNQVIQEYKHVPRHSSGSTAERITGNGKYSLRSWHLRLQPFFPVDLFAVPSWNFIDSIGEMDFVEPGAEEPVRVITVPKTLRTPRIIAIEPVCMQYTQQSILELLVPALEDGKYFSSALGFSDQNENRVLALTSSKTRHFCTLDLSEASDRVHNQLVIRMLECVPDLSDAVQACRSLRADVPGYGVIPLTKFASMGSALCFPIEAMVFLIIVLKAMHEADNITPDKVSIKGMLDRVRIYGDDIIVPVKYAQFVSRELEAFGLKVNGHKSFWNGNFRESCGLDAYDGVEVTPSYDRRLCPESRRNVSEILSAVSLRNQLYKKGCWRTCAYLTSMLEKIADFPYVLEDSPLVGFVSFLGYEAKRYNRNLHRWETKGFVVKAVPRRSLCDPIGALMKFFLKRGLDPIHDVKHLERYGRPRSVDIKTRWATPY